MLSLRVLGTALILLVCAGLGYAAGFGRNESLTAQELAQGFRNTRVLAKPKPGVLAADLQSAETARGVALHRTFPRIGHIRVLQLTGGADVATTLSRLRASGLYEYVEPDYLRKAQAVPNDPRFNEQWALHNTGQNGGKSGADIGATTAWDTRSSAPNIIVGVVDSGIRTTHEDLSANLWTNPNETANGTDEDGNGYIDDIHGINAIVDKGSADSGKIDDDEGHGTSVASVIAAAGNNGKGMAGVSWNTKLMALKFSDATGYGSTSDMAECIGYAVAKGAKIINISYGGSGYSQTEYDAIKGARDAGVIVVASAGNDGASDDVAANYPASIPLENVVSVANTDRNDELSPSSVYGGLVELGAPGTDILTCSNQDDTSYRSVDGTSLSSPMVAGALALVAAQFPSDNYRQLINRVLRSVDKISSLNGKVQTGGRLNLQKALASTNNRPFNDDFANRAILTGDRFHTRGANLGATAEPGEPTHAAAGGTSLWWSWTATQNGTAVVDTNGSTFDTTVAVYTGTAVNALTSVASNDNASGRTTSRATFTAVSGTTYQIAVDGKGGATGLVQLEVGLVPSNDNFAAATALTGLTARSTGSTQDASRESGEPVLSDSGLSGVGKTVWYRWTAPKSAYFTFSAYTKSYSPILGVFTGSSVSTLSNVATGTDVVFFQAANGTTYYIAVDSTTATAGGFTLTLTEGVGIEFSDQTDPSPTLGTDGALLLADDSSQLFYFKDSSHSWDDTTITGRMDVNTPVIGPDNTIYVTTTDGLFAITPDKTHKWTKTFKGVASSPAVASDGSIYVHTDDGTLHAFAADGTERWQTPVPGVSYSSPSITTDGVIYLGSDDNNLYAVDSSNGHVKWKYNTGGQVYSSPAIASDGTIYVGNLNSQFLAITSAGALKWSITVGGNVSSSAAVGTDGTIYFGCYDGNLYAVTATGTVQWKYATGDEIRASSPAIGTDGTIYIGSYEGSVHAVTPTGTLKQKYTTGGPIRSSPLIGQGTLAFGSADRRFYLVDISGGDPAASNWPLFRQNISHTGQRVLNTAPSISQQPSSTTVAIGGSTTLSVSAQGQAPMTFQWYFNGAAIPGATQSTYTITNASDANAGTYTVVITNSLGSVTSSAATVTVAAASDVGRIINLSARAVAGTGDQTLIVGFVVNGGSGNKPILIRGIGPTLANYGVSSGFLQDPSLDLYQNTTQIGANSDWGTDTQVPSVMQQVGAFSFTSDKDAAMVATLATGSGYSAHVTTGSGAPSGIALAEFYDASPVYTVDTPRLVNISARSQVGLNDNVLIVGFVIGGTTPVKVLIRGIGPSLSQFGVGGLLADPKIELRKLNDSNIIQQNDNWGSSPDFAALQAAMTQVNAFALPTDSKDAAILVTLQPGAYTAVVSGVNNTTGVGLAEVYEVP